MRISDWSSDVCSSDLFSSIAARKLQPSAAPSAHALAAKRRAVASSFGSVLPSYRRIACLRHDCASRSTSHAWGSSAGLLLGDRAADAGASVNKPPSAKAKTRTVEHTSELQSLMRISYADFYRKKNKKRHN